MFIRDELMNIEKLLEANDDVKLNCPDCYDVWYGEDCPTTCTTCWCECGRGTLSLEVIIEYVKKNVKSNNI